MGGWWGFLRPQGDILAEAPGPEGEGLVTSPQAAQISFQVWRRKLSDAMALYLL